MREIDELKVVFLDGDIYFSGLNTPSVFGTIKETDANFALVLSPGVKEADVSDQDIRDAIKATTIHGSPLPDSICIVGRNAE